ncbi:MAG: hypothetical protein JST10_07635 [Bacteroidetes bacterium]|nr:hypothetical protein [Bacteroidota bacterium]MBS1632429.1 hypothetical protein [Bacteroidota bacterium]
MKYFALIIFSILTGLISTAQINPLFVEQTARQADSLKIIARQTNNDTIRMSAFRDLTLYYLDFNSDSALLYSKQELPIAEKLNMKLWKADAYDLNSVVLSNLGQYPESLKMINAALAIAKDESSERNIWHINKFTTTGDARKARLSMLATIQLDKGGLYRSTQDFEKQMIVHKECLETASLINDFTIITIVQLNLGNLYRDKNMQDSALYFYNESISNSAKCGFRKYASSAYNGLGEIYMRRNNFQLARQALDSAYSASTQLNNQGELASYNSLMAQLLSKFNEPDSAIVYANKGADISKQTGSVRNIIKAYGVLAEIYRKQNRFDSAYKYLELTSITKDSINSMDKMKQFQNIGFDAQIKLQELEKERIETKGKTRTISMLGGLLVLVLLALILYRNNRQKQKAKLKIENAYEELKSTQQQLIQSEKMASLGELTAGIAHEIQNPLNFVNNFSEVNSELVSELVDEVDKGNTEEVKALANDIKDNSEKINHHGKRAGDIVKGMLQHSRKGTGQKELTDINDLCDEYLRLSYHGLRAKDKSFNAQMKTDFDTSLPKIKVVSQDIGRVILNLINNAFYAAPLLPKEGFKDPAYRHIPTVWVSTKKEPDKVLISIKDNGPGIPKEILDKIFQPFFTTKPAGQGTGLGLSLSYDIVKAHSGELKVNTKSAGAGWDGEGEGTGTEFIISLPIS